MMKILIILIGLTAYGCVSQSEELTLEESGIHVFYEEPNIAYENLGRIDTTSRADNAMGVMKKILGRAVDLDADAVIVHSIINKGEVGGGSDAFGTGGGSAPALYQIQATALRYIESSTPPEPEH